MTEALTWIVLAGAALGAILKWLLIPIHKTAKKVDEFVEAAPTLIEIAAEFKPNHSTSLRDVVDRIEANQKNQADRIETVENKVDTYLLNRLPGGQRCTDPSG
jgi:hypothetical protein